jgi:hypothetical protein
MCTVTESTSVLASYHLHCHIGNKWENVSQEALSAKMWVLIFTLGRQPEVKDEQKPYLKAKSLTTIK